MHALAVIWRASGLLFATSVDSVLEVLPPLACTPTPAVPEWVRGLFLYRDRLIPLVQVSGLLGMPPTPDRMLNRILVVRCTLADSSFNSPVGLWVESVLELERVDFDAVGSHPGFTTEMGVGVGRFLGPVVQTPWGQVQLVRPADLFTPEQAAVLGDRVKEAAA